MKKHTFSFLAHMTTMATMLNSAFSISGNPDGTSILYKNFLKAIISKEVGVALSFMMFLPIIIYNKESYSVYLFLILFMFFMFWVSFSSQKPSYDKNTRNFNPDQSSKKTGYFTFTKINTYILIEKKYMESDLSLGNISEKFKISKGYLSLLINTHTQKSFNDYINELRIEASKKMLVDIHYEKYTIESIGLECGFNSKSNFYTSFKKFSGQTPNQFKKLQK